MAVTAKLYGLALQSAFNKEIDWDTDVIKVMLCTSAYTPDQDTHQYKSSVTNEASGTGYTAGGATLAASAPSYTAGTNTLVLDAADTAWTGSTITARYAVIYNSSPGTDATQPLIAYVDFGADVSTTAGTFTITWDAAGLVTLTAA
ncbi:hypothetical protein G9444_2479 [Rhodococcus erythropolis]|uniref:Uncharacterized protein n=1 Tax=Rhodococcus erythropolis TaxID=1833 RepID=A0A6G9CRP9_RHOER|nr:hypothetical protein [Rhodococcus erythropolis]QIP39723.1 hypothetical protein G9444_2479 [Rhodococcus erythropolis]